MRRNAQAGRYRYRVDVQRVTQTADSVGQPSQSWATLETRWADLRSVDAMGGGREFTRADAISADVSHVVEMRYFDGLTPKDRILFGSRVFEIDSVANVDERNRISLVFVRETV